MIYKLTNDGYYFTKGEDTILRRWPWTPERKSQGKYYSVSADYNFNSIEEYWQRIGRLSERINNGGRISSASFREAILTWAKTKFPGEVLLVLWDIDYSSKAASFWYSIPASKGIHFANDIVVFHCSDVQEALEIRDSVVEDNFSNAVLLKNTEVIDSYYVT